MLTSLASEPEGLLLSHRKSGHLVLPKTDRDNPAAFRCADGLRRRFPFWTNATTQRPLRACRGSRVCDVHDDRGSLFGALRPRAPLASLSLTDPT